MPRRWHMICLFLYWTAGLVSPVVLSVPVVVGVGCVVVGERGCRFLFQLLSELLYLEAEFENNRDLLGILVLQVCDSLRQALHLCAHC